MSERRTVARGLIFVGAATLVGNGAAYLLSMVAARVLTPEEFGAMGALLGILVIISTVGIATQALTARRVAVATPGQERTRAEGDAIRLSVLSAVVIALAGLLAAWPLGALFTIPPVAVACGIASIGFVVIGSAAMGISQGREEHLRLSWGFVVNGVSRAVVGIVTVVLLDSVVGVGVGILIGTAIGAVISYRISCPGAWSRSIAKGTGAEFGHTLHALIVLFTLTNVDVLLARVFLTEQQSGEYSVGVLLDSVVGVGVGILIGTAIGAVISYRISCPGAWSRSIAKGTGAEFGHTLHALIVLFTLTNVDVLLARVFLTEQQSGEYSVGVLLAKIAFFLPNAIVLVLFPRMASTQSRRTVYLATGLTAAVGLVITLVSLVLGNLVIRILGGAQYTHLGSEAWLFALEGSAFALVQVLLYARLASEDRRAVVTVWGGLAVLVAVVALWRHSSVASIVTTVVAVSLLLVIVGLVMDRRQMSAPAAELPLEPAE